ncbi:DUF3450 domain-containing protein [Sansalvadorimonas sp. 2012CJ34-2]|uniref:DUF3450 domain-containing protein n=1 Tax=Parendozoicomonas callyspongiae TaxID=2942213 RepID=A0ABT0PCL2_9GAMM|nr:DUF3450 family protein [Sansalvadorimonas sp. 2012CJ34-2]MCL6269115.1 DUF3450 domain-containing protein [Sansalvadorimonas sp. 2012CJ34-2]
MKTLQLIVAILLTGIAATAQSVDHQELLKQRLEALTKENGLLKQTIGRQERQISRQKQELSNTIQLQQTLDLISDKAQSDIQSLQQNQPYLQTEISEHQKAHIDSPKSSERFLTSLSLMREELESSISLTSWSGQLESGQKVEFIKLGRIALYYLTPDAQEGAIYLPEKEQWRALTLSQTLELIKARNMTLMEKSGDWLHLPLPRTRIRQEGES